MSDKQCTGAAESDCVHNCESGVIDVSQCVEPQTTDPSTDPSTVTTTTQSTTMSTTVTTTTTPTTTQPTTMTTTISTAPSTTTPATTVAATTTTVLTTAGPCNMFYEAACDITEDNTVSVKHDLTVGGCQVTLGTHSHTLTVSSMFRTRVRARLTAQCSPGTPASASSESASC